jgi:integrase
MSRQATGTLVEHLGKDGRTYRSARFRAYGQRRFVRLGPVSKMDAERELRGILADVERGIWQPPKPAPVPEPAAPVPTFHAFAEQWWIEHQAEWRESTRADYRWRLENHLLPFFAKHPLDTITVAEVDRYKAAKLAQGALGGESINKTLVLLSAVLETAEERELIPRNPAKGRRRRVRTHRPQRTYLDSADQIAALLDAARDLDAEARADRRHIARHATLAVLVFAGLRLGELLDLRWRDIDLANSRLRVGHAKTDAGIRHIKIRPALHDTLAALKATRTTAAPDAYVFGTTTGERQSPSNIRNRTLAPAVERANATLATDDLPPLPKITPHSLRRTFASLLYAIGEPPPVVMAEMGHTDAGLALRIYAQAMRGDGATVSALCALVNGEDGTRSTLLPASKNPAEAVRRQARSS